MKAVISKIEQGIVFARTVNPMGEKPPNYDVSKADGRSYKFLEWKAAENHRMELPLHPDDCRLGNYQNTCSICDKDFIGDKIQFVCLKCAPNLIKHKFQIGQEINVTEDQGYFKIL